GELAEVLARAQDAENHLAAILAHEHDFHATVAHDEQRIAGIILEQDDAALWIALFARQLSKALQLGILELGKKRNRPQEVGYLHQSECSARNRVITNGITASIADRYSVDGRRHRRRVTNRCPVASRKPSRPLPESSVMAVGGPGQVLVCLSFALLTGYI